jgi:hypothetical protein
MAALHAEHRIRGLALGIDDLPVVILFGTVAGSVEAECP